MKASFPKVTLKTCWTTVKNKTIKVALIHAKLGLKGGLETRLQNYIEFFLLRGDEVTVVCSRVDTEVTLDARVTLIKLNTRYFPKPLRPWLFYQKVRSYLKDTRFDFSLSLGRTAGQHAVLAPANHLAYLNFLGKGSQSFSDQLQVYLDRQAFESSKTIFACSQMVKQELIDLYGTQASKIEVLYPPINISKFNPNLKTKKTALRLKHQLSPNQKIFLFVSTGHTRKGLPFLLELFSKLDPKKHLLLVSGKPEVKTSLENVQNIGFNSNLNEWYALSDFLIHPAKYEPFGQIVTEAIYMKTPVLISDHVGAKELITSEVGLVLPEGNLGTWQRIVESTNFTAFTFETDFVKENQLSLNDHMKKMLSTLNL